MATATQPRSHAVFHRAFDEALHHVIGVVAVAEQVLRAAASAAGLRMAFFTAQADHRRESDGRCGRPSTHSEP